MGDTLWPTFKNSKCQMQLITLSPPRFAPLYFLVDEQQLDRATFSQQKLLIEFSWILTKAHHSDQNDTFGNEL
jgi:hypothetical protein